jgi:cytochrome c oxidase assembly protein subunit 11
MAQTNEHEVGEEAPASNGTMLRKLAVMALVMFGFGFALVPFYQRICEVTGVNFLTGRDPQAERFAQNTQVDRTRVVTVEFDANSRGPWTFKPERNALDVHPGELVTIEYDITNHAAQDMTGQSIPSYAPAQAARYFRKIECFCFRQQTLPSQKTRRFPVVFVVDPDLPRDIRTITLSYTFFEIPGAQAEGRAAPVLAAAKADAVRER